MIEKIISGGQTGVDRAALDAALMKTVACGGWCPKHRRAEDGRISNRYPLIEAESANYAQRTALNVRDTDGTLILITGVISRGTALTRELAERYGKPVLIRNIADDQDFAPVEQWISDNRIRTLNVAGPRESSQPGIYQIAFDYLQRLLMQVALPSDQSGNVVAKTARRKRATKGENRKS